MSIYEPELDVTAWEKLRPGYMRIINPAVAAWRSGRLHINPRTCEQLLHWDKISGRLGNTELEEHRDTAGVVGPFGPLQPPHIRMAAEEESDRFDDYRRWRENTERMINERMTIPVIYRRQARVEGATATMRMYIDETPYDPEQLNRAPAVSGRLRAIDVERLRLQHRMDTLALWGAGPINEVSPSLRCAVPTAEPGL